MTIGEFLQKVVEWIYEFWPIRIIRVWEQGVRLRAGNVTGLLTSTNGWFGSGVHGFVPLLGEILSDEVNSRVVETGWQSLTTKDGVAVSFSLAARYRIRDLAKLYVGIHESGETIENQLSAAASLVILDMTFTELEEGFTAAVLEEARKRLNEWGVSLLEVNLFNLVKASALRLINE